MISAPRVAPFAVVNNAGVAVDKRSVLSFVAQHFASGPLCESLLRHPQAISSKAIAGYRIAEAHETFAFRNVRRIGIARGWKVAVVRTHEKCDESSGGLARHDRTEDSVV